MTVPAEGFLESFPERIDGSIVATDGGEITG
jgi:hypothetical protein